MSVPDRLLSVNALSKLTGWDRGTIDTWMSKGCPVARRSAGPGDEHLLDIGDVWRWHVQHTKAEAIRRAMTAGADGEGGFSGWMGIREPGKAFDAQLKLMKVAEKAGELALWSRLENALALAMNAIRVNVMTVPEVIFREMSGFPDEKTLAWRRTSLDQCRAALTAAERDLAKAMEADAEADDAPVDA
ncbi:hypothetical protein [Methylobacterium sp. MA0201]|uniref:hypothetical protein n=1 Tax=Methylobacterium alsaeris TaxID=3344826 RepID=UPI00375806AA